MPVVIPPGTKTLTTTQRDSLDDYTVEMLRWQSDEAIIKQAIASTISDSLFLELSEKGTAFKMWEAVKSQREKKTQMVTVDMRRKLQAKKCPESGDMRAHLHKLQAIRENLAWMGDPVKMGILPRWFWALSHNSTTPM